MMPFSDPNHQRCGGTGVGFQLGPKPALTNNALNLTQPHPVGKRRQNRLPDGTPASRFPWQNGSDP
jgi:hypothetical protein